MDYPMVLKVISQPIRLEIIGYLLDGHTCGCTLIDKLPISQPTLSFHLVALAKAGVATKKREGNKIKYYINRDVLDNLSTYFNHMSKTASTSCSL